MLSKREGTGVKNLFKKLQGKCNLVRLANMCALALAIGSVNTACFWLHHQPEVPEGAKALRKF